MSEQSKSMWPTLLGDLRSNGVGLAMGLISFTGLGSWIASHAALVYDQGWGACVIVGIILVFLCCVAAFSVFAMSKALKKEPLFVSSEPVARTIATALVSSAEKMREERPDKDVKPQQEAPVGELSILFDPKGNGSEVSYILHGTYSLTGGPITVLLDVSTQLMGLMWAKPRRIRIGELPSHIKQEHFSLPLISKRDGALGWGNQQMAGQNPIGLDEHFGRCQVLFIQEGGAQCSFSFMMVNVAVHKTQPYAVLDEKTIGSPNKWFAER